ncbi:hypothetical protein ACFE04_021268 [Oxalis oulophora]
MARHSRIISQRFFYLDSRDKKIQHSILDINNISSNSKILSSTLTLATTFFAITSKMKMGMIVAARSPVQQYNDDDDDDDDDVAVSHQDYINQRSLFYANKNEVSSYKPYEEELTADVLQQGASSSNLNLVDYESDANQVDQVMSTSEQRFPHPGEPACVICGKYGEYICNETNDDICSLECKAVLLESVKQPEKPMSNPNQDVCSSAMKCAMPLPEFGEDTWDHDRHCWSKTRSTLSTYECWKCQKPGHLAEDCLVVSRDEVDLGHSRSNNIFLQCIRGHLNEHIGHNPSHQQYYSHKLKRLVKCCKSTCEITDIKNLLACHYCFDKAFEKFYDMYTATWKIAGLSMIWGSICCVDHFDWHRMNCLCADTEGSAYIVPRNIPKGKRVEVENGIEVDDCRSRVNNSNKMRGGYKNARGLSTLIIKDAYIYQIDDLPKVNSINASQHYRSLTVHELKKIWKQTWREQIWPKSAMRNQLNLKHSRNDVQ